MTGGGHQPIIEDVPLDRTRDILHQILTASFDSPHSFPGLVDRQVTRNRSLHSEERRGLTTLLHDTVRWRRRIFGDVAPSHLDLPRLEASLAEARQLRGSPPLEKWKLSPVDSVARAVSYPTWLLESWVGQLGFESAVSLALSMNEPAPITFRTNVLKIDRKSLQERLRQEGVETVEGKHSPWALHLMSRQNVRALRVYKQGFLEVQDEGSQLSVLECGAKSGDRVIDACARTGGKSLALAALMGNRGSILATDADARPLEALERRVKRSGVSIVQAAWVAPDDPNPLASFREKADLVFLDAPCSGFGTLRRKPWMKWVASSEGAGASPEKQFALLRRYSSWVRKGGLLSYVTCTIHAKENEEVIGRFLTEATEFRLRGSPRTVRPDVEGCDGFFFCSMERLS